MCRKYISGFIFFCLVNLASEATDYEIKSPGGDITVTVKTEKILSYSIKYKGTYILEPSALSMTFQPGKRPDAEKIVTKVIRQSVNNKIIPPVKEKRAIIPDIYNEMKLIFTDNTELHFRAYDDGVAYRFSLRTPGEVIIENEQAEFNINDGTLVYYPQVVKRQDADIYHTSFEEPYTISAVDTIPDTMYAFNPVLLYKDGLPSIIITESDIDDYPGMFLVKGEGSALKGAFAPYPVKEIVSEGEFRQKLVVERAPYIARIKGPRSFPWRVIAIAEKDADLLVNDIVYRLAPGPRFSDFSWIKPGKSTEEWITGLNLYGVDFKAGLNTETYKYYIDFASKFGFEYVMLDAGWSDVNDLFQINPDMDMDEITAYAENKGIGLILWTQALTIERQMEQAFKQFKKWGIRIVMTDFIDRDDQMAMNFMHWFAGECAKAGFMCMIHGAPKPAGFSRTYPNMLTREGVLGSEYNIWSSKADPEHDLLLPFIRMTAGPMDYEPGLLQNATRGNSVKMGFEKVIAQGTRMHQIAMFIVYESPLQLFSGNLSDALREPELMTFLGKIPTVWDETLILHAKLGKYIVEARRKGDEWYIGAINDWDPCTFQIPLSFLGTGSYIMEEAADGINADRNPHDYRIKSSEVKAGIILNIKLAPGGGYVAKIIRKQSD